MRMALISKASMTRCLRRSEGVMKRFTLPAPPASAPPSNWGHASTGNRRCWTRSAALKKREPQPKKESHRLTGLLSAPVQAVQFTFQLVIAGQTITIEGSGICCLLNSAARLTGVTAITKAAVLRQGINLGKGFAQIRTFPPQMQLAHAGVVHQDAAVRQQKQFP